MPSAQPHGRPQEDPAGIRERRRRTAGERGVGHAYQFRRRPAGESGTEFASDNGIVCIRHAGDGEFQQPAVQRVGDLRIQSESILDDIAPAVQVVIGTRRAGEVNGVITAGITAGAIEIDISFLTNKE